MRHDDIKIEILISNFRVSMSMIHDLKNQQKVRDRRMYFNLSRKKSLRDFRGVDGVSKRVVFYDVDACERNVHFNDKIVVKVSNELCADSIFHRMDGHYHCIILKKLTCLSLYVCHHVL